MGTRTELHQWFAKDGRVVGVYVALYSQQKQGSELIVSQNQLVSPANNDWVNVGERRTRVQWGGDDVSARAAEITGRGVHLTARAWYWVNGRFTAFYRI